MCTYISIIIIIITCMLFKDYDNIAWLPLIQPTFDGGVSIVAQYSMERI